MNLVKNRIIDEQKYLIGIEAVIDMKNFVLLLLADLARKSTTFCLDNEDLMIASLPLNYCEIIEKIMYTENGWGIKFAELIDIYSYYENQSDWEKELGRTITKIIQDEKLHSNLDLEYNCIEIQFTKEGVKEIRSRFDDETLDIMNHFSSLIDDASFKRLCIIEANEITRNLNRFQYIHYVDSYFEFVRNGIKNPKEYIKEFEPIEKI